MNKVHARRERLASGAIDGGAAMLSALVLGYAAHLGIGAAFVAEAIAERIFEVTPVEWALLFLPVLNIIGKPLAVAGALGLLTWLGALVGAGRAVLEPMLNRTLTWSVLGAAGASFVVVGTTAAIIGSSGAWSSLWPLLTYGPLLTVLRLTAPAPASDGRRWFLRRASHNFLALVGLSSLATWPIAWRNLGGADAHVETLFPFTPPSPRQSGFDLPRLTPEVTSTADFYIMSKSVQDPRIAGEDWALYITGRVGRSLRLTLAELRALQGQNQWTTLRCVSNPIDGPLMSNGLWTGVPVAGLLAEAGIEPSAVDVVFHGRDDYADSLPLDVVMAQDVLVAYGLNGRSLDRTHGYPARLVAPGIYGFKNVKWLDRIEVVDYDFKGRWQELGWTETALIKTVTRIDVAQVMSDSLIVAGVAFAGRRGISRVEVRVDGGAWRPAALHTPALPGTTWIQWRLDGPRPASTRFRVEARAVDGRGETQTEIVAPPFPDGASGWHRLTVES